jgi:hypothetical protein
LDKTRREFAYLNFFSLNQLVELTTALEASNIAKVVGYLTLLRIDEKLSIDKLVPIYQQNVKKGRDQLVSLGEFLDEFIAGSTLLPLRALRDPSKYRQAIDLHAPNVIVVSQADQVNILF